MNINKIWQSVLELIKDDVNAVSFNTWFKPLKIISIDYNKAYIEVPEDFIRKMIKQRYNNLIRNAFEHILEEEIELVFVTPNEKNNTNIENSETEIIHTNKNKLNNKYKFDNFIIGNSNRFAHAASLAVAEAPAIAYNPLFIYGGVGLGKTHLMHAIGHYILENNPDVSVLYVTSEKFTNDLINSIKDDTNDAFRNKYRKIDVLLIDDIQFIAGKERTQEEFFHTFNTLHESNKQIIISSDSPPNEIPTLEDRLRSRFEWGLIADIQPPDLETRIAILRKKAEDENYEVPDEIMTYIAQNIQSNIRKLEGALIRLFAYSSLTNNKEITLDLAKEALKHLISNNKKITTSNIKDAISNYYNVSIEDLLSKKKPKNISYPRQIAMYISRKLTELSLPRIGEEFGGRDHSTVLHAYNKISNDIENSPDLKQEIEDLISSITN